MARYPVPMVLAAAIVIGVVYVVVNANITTPSVSPFLKQYNTTAVGGTFKGVVYANTTGKIYYGMLPIYGVVYSTTTTALNYTMGGKTFTVCYANGYATPLVNMTAGTCTSTVALLAGMKVVNGTVTLMLNNGTTIAVPLNYIANGPVDIAVGQYDTTGQKAYVIYMPSGGSVVVK
ncbi:hypothetical protein TTSV1_gp23 [Thermoproteus tenax spherical virus 1]|uniref:Uncharacterized protein n=1 Tax=Thermoproteus tenax spherical virus 1 TaxID=292639 RepID=Q647D9_9VIRU|nr:hypothetical protein TTSV1_gp23 [Thermoproteus tenax spherical virus 1]AAU25973.1 hypothetical protein [Thermoproteus tenax spherical virus 1]